MICSVVLVILFAACFWRLPGLQVKLLLFIILASSPVLKAQKVIGPLVLNNERLPITAKEFYVAGITDNRADRNAVAWLLPPGPGNPEKYTVDLKGGALASIKQFVTAALPPDKTLRPIIIHIEQFRLDETALPGNHVEGKVKVSLSFYLQKDDQNIHLTNYNGSAGYNRHINQEVDIEMVLRHALEYSLTFFNTWINKEAGTNIKLARDVKITFTDYTEQTEGDTIYYSPKRPLQWDDFKATPLRNSRFGAEVLPSIGYDEDVEVSKSIIHVHLSTKAFVPKSACWVKDDSKNAYSLNHEQRHFDIVKIIIERFKQKLKAEKLPVDNYDGPINVDYLESYHEMNVMQEQYDAETAHGMNVAVQEQWNKKIDKELKVVNSER
ncbi:hypothetical protein SAMN05428975_0595 [Mucilaginibacter sp. OK268]|uniref:hypothetical protein n=1 Tax=Mucilaginibacter sp. OK268 TaxID=1881048 RepID=UPI0008827410|nr:hypothetical protein [Mucilaginibacter sp. OK268]SDP18028.1 hypothetical protein SAMN05428975_0595 [Mucilaginibacter sp. OK268]